MKGFYKHCDDGTWLFAENEIASKDYRYKIEDFEDEKELEDGWSFLLEAPTAYTDWVEAERVLNIEPQIE